MNALAADRVETGPPALPPIQWSAFVVEHPGDAGPSTGSAGTAAELVEVNDKVNAGIEPDRAVGDQPGYVWRLWPKTGWCGDYAVTKRHELLARGWPSSSLLIAVVIPAVYDNGYEHAVLIARRADGDLVLDNLVDVLRAPSRTGYEWVKVQDEADPMVWANAEVAR